MPETRNRRTKIQSRKPRTFCCTERNARIQLLSKWLRVCVCWCVPERRIYRARIECQLFFTFRSNFECIVWRARVDVQNVNERERELAQITTSAHTHTHTGERERDANVSVEEKLKVKVFAASSRYNPMLLSGADILPLAYCFLLFLLVVERWLLVIVVFVIIVDGGAHTLYQHMHAYRRALVRVYAVQCTVHSCARTFMRIES